MKPFGLYSDIHPALGRDDVFLAVTTYSAEPEPYRELLHFPAINAMFVDRIARRLVSLDGRSDLIPRLTNLGIEGDRYFLAYTLGRLSVAPTLALLRKPVPQSFWSKLRDGVEALHAQGLTYGHLREDTVAITDRGDPLLFDFTSLRSAERQPPEVDIAAINALQLRY